MSSEPQDGRPDRPLPRGLPRVPEPSGSRRVAAAPWTGGSRGRVARALSWLAIATSASVLVASVAGYALVHRYDGRIERVPVFPAGDRDRPPVATTDARNVLLVGSDTRNDAAAGEGTQGTGDTFVTGQRSDTTILAHLYGDSDQAELVSFPRDSWVTIPAHTSVRTGEFVEAGKAKLNVAIEDGGPALLISTLEELSGLRIDHYAQIDFDGFQSMVDALDGVEVCLSEPAEEEKSGIDLPAGRQTVKGAQALAFVRQRYGLPRGDLDRIARQQQFIGAIVRKTLSAQTLLNPFKLNGVLDVATDALKVDDGTSIGDLRDLALRFRNFDADGVAFTTVPVADINAEVGKQKVVLLDDDGLDALFSRIRDDVPPGGPAQEPAGPPAPPLIVAPDRIRVQVYNGAGVAGLGRRAYDDLAAGGFAVVGAPDDRGTTARQTTVYYGPDRADSARTVAAAIPGSRTELDPDLARTLDVVVGSSYTGTRPVEITGSSPPAPQVTAPARTAADDPCAV